MITSKLYSDLNLAVHTVDGGIEFDEFVKVGIAIYKLNPPPLLSLWDLSAANFSDIALQKIKAMQLSAVGEVRGREGGKTAIVAPQDITYGTGRQYTMLIEAFNLPFEHRMFRSLSEACDWLDLNQKQLAQSQGMVLCTET